MQTWITAVSQINNDNNNNSNDNDEDANDGDYDDIDDDIADVMNTIKINTNTNDPTTSDINALLASGRFGSYSTNTADMDKSEICGQQRFHGTDGQHCFFNLKIIFDPFKVSLLLTTTANNNNYYNYY